MNSSLLSVRIGRKRGKEGGGIISDFLASYGKSNEMHQMNSSIIIIIHVGVCLVCLFI